MTASSSVSRKMRGFGLPACGSGVTVPISAKPKPRPQQRVGHLGVLVVAGRHAERIGKIEPATRDAQPRVARRLPATGRPQLQRLDRQAMRRLRIEA